MTEEKPISKSVLVRNSTYNFIGMTLPLLVGVIAIPYAISGLGKDTFGILTLVWTILGYLSLLDFGIARATTKFTSQYYKNNERDKIPNLFWTSIVVNIMLGFVSAFAFFGFCPFLVKNILNININLQPVTIATFRLLAFFLPVMLMSVNFKGMLGAAQRFDLVNIIHVPINITGFVVPAITVIFTMDLFVVTFIILIIRSIGAFFYLILCFSVYPECKRKPKIDKEALRKIFAYGGWVTISGFISPLLVNMDRFFIGSILTMQSLTFYSAPLEAIQRIRVFPQAIMNTLFPEFSQGIQTKTKKRLNRLFWKSFKIIALLTGLICIFIGVHANDLLNIWLGKDFADESTLLVQVFSIGVFLNLLAHVPFTFLQGIGRPDIPAKFHLVEVPIYIMILWVFITKFGLLGAALAWSLRVFFDFLLLFYRSFTLLPKPNCSDEIKALFKGSIVLVCFMLVNLLSQSFFINNYIRLLIGVLLIALSVLCIYFLILTQDEKSIIDGILKKN